MQDVYFDGESNGDTQAVIWEQIGPCQWHHNVYPHTVDFQDPEVYPVISQGSFWLSVVTNNPGKQEHGLLFYLRVAVCILCFAWNLTWGFGFPMPKLHRGASSRVSQSHSSMSRNSEGAGLWLLSSVCQAGGGTLRSLHAEVLQRSEVLPEHGGWITFATAHPGFRTVWTKSGLGCNDESGPAGYKWWVKAALSKTFSPDSSAPVSSTERFSLFQLHCFGFTAHNFTVLVRPQCSRQHCFQKQRAAVFS